MFRRYPMYSEHCWQFYYIIIVFLWKVQPNEETHKVKSVWVPNPELPYLLSASTKFQRKRFYYGFVIIIIFFFYLFLGFPGGSSSKEPAAIAGDLRDLASILGSGRSPGGEQGNPLQYSCLENPTGRGGWRATVHGVAKSWTPHWGDSEQIYF